jgi:hypothetical protein
MTFKLGQRVIVTADAMEQHLPIGEYGFIIAFERNPDTVFEFVVRIPRLNRHFGVTRNDIESEEAILRREAEKVAVDALVDFALATKNEQLFNRVLGYEQEELHAEHLSEEQMSQEEFIRQVNARAWI